VQLQEQRSAVQWQWQEAQVGAVLLALPLTPLWRISRCCLAASVARERKPLRLRAAASGLNPPPLCTP
jgi:hypothetical protein